jgi:hypothetical protein
MSQTNAKKTDAQQACMDRRKTFSGFGCSECAWVFSPSGLPTGNSFDEMMRNFELQRDREFTSQCLRRSLQRGYVHKGMPHRANVKI